MKLWIDNIRPAPKDYVWCRTVNDAKYMISKYSERVIGDHIRYDEIELIDIDYDAGDYIYAGGDYIRLLNWLEETGRNYPIHIHSANPVGVANMRRIIQRNNWQEVF